MPRRIVVVGLGLTLAGLFLTAWSASLGRVAEEVDTDPTSSPDLHTAGEAAGTDLSAARQTAGAGETVAVLAAAKLRLTAFATPTTSPQPAPPPAPVTLPPPPPTPAPVTLPPAPLGAAGPGEVALEALRDCESGGDYAAVSPGGWYRGAYQFSQGTWDSVASRWRPELVGVDPAAAAPADQDAMARAIYDEAGGSPWPYCGRYL